MTFRAVLAVACMSAAAAAAATASAPLLSITTAAPGSWPQPEGALHPGDVRAVVRVNPAATASPAEVTSTIQLWWRRRDAGPENKGLLVKDADHNPLDVKVRYATNDCGVIDVTHNAADPRPFYVYYLPYYESGSNAALHFHWYNCTEQTRECVLNAPRRAAGDSAATCEDVLPGAAYVVGLENRPAAPHQRDHTPDGHVFQGFTPLELTATEGEVAGVTAAVKARNASVALYMEPRRHVARLFDALPAVWARRELAAGRTRALDVTAAPGEYLTYQLGLFAATADTQVTAVEFSHIAPAAGAAGAGCAAAPTVPSTAQTCFNLGGVDLEGKVFTKAYRVRRGGVGVMWMGAQLPGNAASGCTLTGTVRVTTTAVGSGREEVEALTVNIAVSGPPVADGGDENIYNMTRLRWLNSRKGHEPTAVAPYTPVRTTPPAGKRRGSQEQKHNANAEATGLPQGGMREPQVSAEEFTVHLLNKDIVIGANGLPQQATVYTPKQRGGAAVVRATNAFASPVQFTVADATGRPVALRAAPAADGVPNGVAITEATDELVRWSAVSTAAVTGADGAALNLRVVVNGTAYFDSFMSFSVDVDVTGGGGGIDVSDIRVAYAPADARYMVGWGRSGAVFQPTRWRWSEAAKTTGLWAGGADAGVYFVMKGDGEAWNNPLYSKDYPQIPFIPESWGGVGAKAGATGGDIANGTVVGFSGPRRLEVSGGPTRFLFDMVVTPAKPFDFAKHATERIVQVGYGTSFMTIDDVARRGASVVTLHQGTSGVVNDTLVNPYINYPFIPDTVELLETYTREAHHKGMRVKFYYTIRELSNHAVELYALLSLQGEVFLDQDAYIEPQAGYCQDWDCRGGDAYLHEHIGRNYTYCWQQALSNGEIDAAVCNTGASRWFNYYVEGLSRSVAHAPHIDGIYFDGINFSPSSMRRVRRVLSDAAAARGVASLVDLHTGNLGASDPPATNYLPYFAHADALWNGEGFDFTQPEAYWFAEVSGVPFGVPADRLGGSPSRDDYRGMLYGSTQRNSGTATALWSQLWDAYALPRAELIGYWEPAYDLPVTTPPATPNVKASTYLAYGTAAVVVLASWEPADLQVPLVWNATALGFTPRIGVVPGVDGLQPAGTVANVNAPLGVKGNSGVIIVVTP